MPNETEEYRLRRQILSVFNNRECDLMKLNEEHVEYIKDKFREFDWGAWFALDEVKNMSLEQFRQRIWDKTWFLKTIPKHVLRMIFDWAEAKYAKD